MPDFQGKSHSIVEFIRYYWFRVKHTDCLVGKSLCRMTRRILSFITSVKAVSHWPSMSSSLSSHILRISSFSKLDWISMTRRRLFNGFVVIQIAREGKYRKPVFLFGDNRLIVKSVSFLGLDPFHTIMSSYIWGVKNCLHRWPIVKRYLRKNYLLYCPVVYTIRFKRAIWEILLNTASRFLAERSLRMFSCLETFF